MLTLTQNPNPYTLNLPLTLNTNDARNTEWPLIDNLADECSIPIPLCSAILIASDSLKTLAVFFPSGPGRAGPVFRLDYSNFVQIRQCLVEKVIWWFLVRKIIVRILPRRPHLRSANFGPVHVLPVDGPHVRIYHVAIAQMKLTPAKALAVNIHDIWMLRIL